MKMMKKKESKTFSYSVFYEQAPEGGYVAVVPTLPGCHTQGESLEEAERNVKEAIAVYSGKPGGPRGRNSGGGAFVPGPSDGSRLMHV